jgi:two-component system sensor histidine kinase PilS (NtrC family)
VISPKLLNELSKPLYRAFVDWQSNHAQDLMTRAPDLNSIKGLQVRITRVGARKEDQGSIIYLEDAAEINRHIQETKLASLGRLTASIAHEIRNPLGAISHAAQLLAESPELNRPDKRLVGIINDHSNRMNEIIQNILQLSRKEQPKQELLPLQSWLARFIEEFNRTEGLPKDWIEIHMAQPQTVVYMDPNHLHQVLWNLCVNATKYGTPPGAEPKLLLQGGISADTDSPYLDVIDFGPGIDPSVQSQLFEPFFTTHSSGTGLGLYICRQLCERNDGDLIFISRSNYGSCFRIQFPIHYAEDNKVATRAYR